MSHNRSSSKEVYSSVSTYFNATFVLTVTANLKLFNELKVESLIREIFENTLTGQNYCYIYRDQIFLFSLDDDFFSR